MFFVVQCLRITARAGPGCLMHVSRLALWILHDDGLLQWWICDTTTISLKKSILVPSHPDVRAITIIVIQP